MWHLARLLCFMALLCNVSVSIWAAELLTIKEVPTIMQQIFDQHVSHKQMTTDTLKNSFTVYINQFDPLRLYLLDSEATAFQKLSDEQVLKVLKAYQKEDFQAFTDMNGVIQKAIMRARALRQDIAKNSRPLFYMVETPQREGGKRAPFAKTMGQLESRMKDQLLRFINEEKIKFGTEVVMQNQAQLLNLYEKRMQEKENRYLYVNETGKEIPKNEAENTFALHLLKAFTGSLDAHTTYYNAAEATDLKSKLQKKFEGFGVSLEERPDGKVQIADIVKGSSADNSHQIERKDIVYAINGQSVQNKSYDEVVRMLKQSGAKGAEITLQRGSGTPFKVTLQRAALTVQDDRVKIAYKQVDKGIIGVITLNSFYQGDDQVTSESDVRAAIQKLQKKGNLKGVILDLRENSGGFLIQAVKTAGLFMSNGIVVISKYFNGEEHFYRDLDGKKYYDGPLVILTSRATASAAEIVAQALQDYGLALVVGDKETYGKGTVQNQTVTKEKSTSLFKVTVGRYYTPSGRTPQINGVKADIVVPGTYNYEQIGERFLSGTISADSIAEDFQDSLSDLSQVQKQWFMRNYMPTLQPKVSKWKGMLSDLQERSAKRIAQNAEYQKFIRTLQNHRNDDAASASVDHQLMETVNILKDMITLSPSDRPLEPISDNAHALRK
jgi:carboxyl-terminal processing protease